MTASDLAVSAHVVIQCPACGASETAEPEALAGHPMIVCRECGETWPSARPRVKRRSDLVSQTKAHVESNLVEASRRPLITYSDGAESAWAAKVEGDRWPEPPRPRRIPVALGAVAALFFLAAFFGARDAAVKALPDLAGLYAAIGLTVNLEGIAIEGVAANRTPTAAGDRIVVRGTIRNVAGKAMTVPPLTAILYDSAMNPARAESFDPPAATIGAGKAAPFTLMVDRAPLLATRVAVRFRQPGEKPPRLAGAPQSSATQ